MTTAYRTPEQECLEKLEKMLPYIRYLADRLSLRDWKLDAEIVEGDGTYEAQVVCPHNRKVATIQLTHQFFHSDPKRQRHTLLHELIHCHYLPVQTHVNSHREMFGMFFGPFNKGHDDQLEKGVDGMADAFAGILPDIDEWYEGKDCRICAHEVLMRLRELIQDGKVDEATDLMMSWPNPFLPAGREALIQLNTKKAGR